ncbi:glycosyltransferase family 4 protein [Micromonospora sp. NPDC049559]|uniref:glycosyltransferase family 4 protein n=1 Tax=Micromonospora sp. NPDC049559 TaxID=3155923 RepID=UPI003419294B
MTRQPAAQVSCPTPRVEAPVDGEESPQTAPSSSVHPYGVVRVFGALDVGGAELRTIELLPRLIAAGAEIHFVTLTGRAGVLAPQVERLGARVHPLRLSLAFPPRFLRLLRRLRPRVVHSDVATFSGFILLLAWAARVPVRIAHFRSDADGHGNGPRRRAQRWVMRRLVRLCATDILGVAPGALSHCYLPSWRTDPRCRVIPNGLDLDRLHRDHGFDLRTAVGAAPDEIICMHVGRAAPEKRRWLVPAIVAGLQARGLPARAVLVGGHDPDDDARVSREAEAYGVGDRLHLLGARDDVGSLMRQADVLLLPSQREGLPGVVLEALAVGTAVAASDLPGVRFIAGQLPGVTVLAQDASAADWAEAIDAAGVRPGGDRDRESAAAAFRSSPFSLDAAAAAHLAIYQQRHILERPCAA